MWMTAIWARKQDYYEEQRAEREKRQAAAAELLSAKGEGGDEVEAGMKRLQGELRDATALPPGLEEQDKANTEILSMIVAWVEVIVLVPWVGMLLRCAHDCALAKLEEERAHHAAEPPPPSPGKRPDAVAQLEDNLQRSAALHPH